MIRGCGWTRFPRRQALTLGTVSKAVRRDAERLGEMAALSKPGNRPPGIASGRYLPRVAGRTAISARELNP